MKQGIRVLSKNVEDRCGMTDMRYAIGVNRSAIAKVTSNIKGRFSKVSQANSSWAASWMPGMLDYLVYEYSLMSCGLENMYCTYHKELKGILRCNEQYLINMEPFYAGGIAGLLLFNGMIAKHHNDSILCADVTSRCMDLLSGSLGRLVASRKYEFLYGMSGIGCSVLAFDDTKRGKNLVMKILENIIRLRRAARPHDMFTTWNHKHGEVVDLGMAHGLSGVLNFLSMMYRKYGNIYSICDELKHMTQYILMMYEAEAEAMLPSVVQVSTGKRMYASNLAWCYGDLSTGLGLKNAAEAMNDGNVSRAAKEIIMNTCSRKYNTGIFDSCVCHGSGGLVLMYRIIDKAYNSEKIKSAIRRWEEVTRKYCVCELDGAGYYYVEYDGEQRRYVEKDDFLNGSIGTAIALLSSNDHVLSIVNCMMMIDGDYF